MAGKTLIQQLIDNGIIPSENHGLESDEQAMLAIKGSLQERLELMDEVKSLKASTSKPLKADPADPPPTTPSSASPATAPAGGTGDLSAAETLRKAGIITRKDGQWHSDNPQFQMHAAQLNARDAEMQLRRQELDSMLLERPEEAVSKLFADPLTKMIEDAVKKLVDPLQQQLQQVDKSTVKQPTASQQWFYENKDRLGEGSALAQTYRETYAQIENELTQSGELTDDMSEADRDSRIHVRAAVAAENHILKQQLELLQSGGDDNQQQQSAAGTTQASSSGDSQTSVVDSVNNGQQPASNGTRNNGSARLLNEHAQQTGDTSVPTSGGTVDFKELVKQSLAEQNKTF